MAQTEKRIAAISLWDGDVDRGARSLSWQGGVISDVGEPDSGADASYSVIPGLVDTHVHFDAYAGSGSVDWMTWPLITPAEERSLHVVAHARPRCATSAGRRCSWRPRALSRPGSSRVRASACTARWG